MHSSFMALRRECPMNMRGRAQGFVPSEAVQADTIRILQLWAEARARFGKGGPFLFGSFCAADIFYAPVVSRFRTYGLPMPGFAQAYMDAICEHEWMVEWMAAAEAEDWVIEQYDMPVRV
jgi:glutathione S-transferase